jgi:hypothetical protein
MHEQPHNYDKIYNIVFIKSHIFSKLLVGHLYFTWVKIHVKGFKIYVIFKSFEVYL